jgi:hypothetical protein
MDKRALWMAVLAVGLVSLGCSSSKKKNMDAGPDGGGLTDASTKKKDSGTTTDSGTMMTMTAMPVPCGATMCQQPSGGLAGMLGGLGGMAGGAAGGLGGLGAAIPMAAACCLDMAAGKCGISAGMGGACMKPAVMDMRCPGPDLGALGALAGGGMAMVGCCTDDGKCGVDGAAFGNGCVEDSAAAAMLGAIPLIGGLIMIPKPRACDASSDNDAGMMMTPPDAGGMMSGNDAGH